VSVLAGAGLLSILSRRLGASSSGRDGPRALGWGGVLLAVGDGVKSLHTGLLGATGSSLTVLTGSVVSSLILSVSQLL
jgi:NADH:ubiquinone oxidoreductase subunit H